MAIPVATDSWLAEVVGFACYRLTPPEQLDAVTQLLRTLDEQAQGQRSLAYIKLPSGQVAMAARFTQAGFALVDVSVTFARPPTARQAKRRQTPIDVHAASPAECAQAREIAGGCIVYSRFHMDWNLSTAQANAVNWAWMDSYYRGRRGEAVQVATIEGRVVGFNAILGGQSAGALERSIDLIGVSPDHQRRGIGQALVERFIDDCEALQLPMRVTTQAANIPAVKLYERNGFRLVESALVLHRHVL